MDLGGVDRRGFLGTAAGLVTAVSAPAATAVGVPVGPGAGRGERFLTYTRMTGGSVTGSRAGGDLVAEVQGVLWRVPRGGGRAVQVTGWEL